MKGKDISMKGKDISYPSNSIPPHAYASGIDCPLITEKPTMYSGPVVANLKNNKRK